MTDAPKGSLGFSAGTDAAEENLETKLKRQNWIFFDNLTSILQQLTTFKKVVNRPDLQDPLHVLMQYANFRLPIGVNDKFCERRKLFNILDGNDSCNLPSCAACTGPKLDPRISDTDPVPSALCSTSTQHIV